MHLANVVSLVVVLLEVGKSEAAVIPPKPDENFGSVGHRYFLESAQLLDVHGDVNGGPISRSVNGRVFFSVELSCRCQFYKQL